MTAPYRFSRALLGHKGDVRTVICPTESLIVSGSRDCTARVWVLSDRSSITYDATVLQGHQNYVSAVAAHAPTDGIPLIYTGSNDNSIRAYFLGHSQPDFTLIGHTDTVCALTVDPNGILVSGSWDKSVKVWRNRNCVGTIQGHQAAVWTVLLMPHSCIPDASETDIVILAGSADHCIYVWLLHDVHHKQSSEQKPLPASLVSTLKGHSDCVRCIARVDSHRVLSSSNDASILAWDISTGQCIGEFYGHAHYVYAVATRPDLPIFVSSGEDRSVRIWPMPASDEWIPRRQFSSLQSIPLPCQSAWCVDLTVLGDIVVGGSDSVIRLFSSDPVRQAPPDAIQTYEAELASSKIAATDACGTGDLDVSKLPGPEALLQPGKNEGQVLVIRDSDRSVCYQWSANEFRWIELGDVVGAGNSKLPVHNGKEYDFVFSVDVSDNGQALKLPYNRTEDPWLVAQRFIHEHDLPQDYLDTVAQFIIKNAGPQFNPAPAVCSDPFTGADRYIPGGTNGSTFAVGKLTFEDYFPSKEFICLKTIALDPLLSKLELFNKQENEASIEVKHMNLIRSFSFDMPEEDAVRLTEAALTALSRWPLDKIFPLLDVLRCLVFWPRASRLIFSDPSWAIIYDRSLGHDNLPPANCLLVLRLLCNALAADGPAGLDACNAEHDVPHSLLAVINLTPKLHSLLDNNKMDIAKKNQHQIALASLLHNLSVLAYRSLTESTSHLLKHCAQLRAVPGLCVRMGVSLLSVAPNHGTGSIASFHPEAVYTLFVCVATALLTATRTTGSQLHASEHEEEAIKIARIRLLASAAPATSTNGSAEAEFANWESVRRIIQFWASSPACLPKVRKVASAMLHLLE